MRMDGFISVEGSINRVSLVICRLPACASCSVGEQHDHCVLSRQSHQHLYIDSHPVPSGELQALISKKFARSRFSAYAEDGLDDAAPTSELTSPCTFEIHAW